MTSDEQPQGCYYLARTYLSPELAKHDALCWLIHRQNRAGASMQGYFEDLEYEEEHHWRCCYFSSTKNLSEELDVEFSVWTTEERLY